MVPSLSIEIENNIEGLQGEDLFGSYNTDTINVTKTHTNDGQTSLVTTANIQQPRGKNADYLNYIICFIVTFILLSIAYISAFIMSGTSIDDIKKNLNSNLLIRGIVFLIESIFTIFITSYKNLGLFLFLIYVFTILLVIYSNEGQSSQIDFWVSIGLLIGFYVIFTMIEFFKIMTNGILGETITRILIFIFCIACVFCGIWFGLKFLIILAILFFIMLFAMYGNFFLELSNALSPLLLVIIALGLLFIPFSFGNVNEKFTITQIILSTIPIFAISLYIILFLVHFIYYHGFLSSISFLKWFNLPIMDSAKLRKSPLYIFCEGILFEPFYKYGFLKNRTVIKEWHKIYDLKEGIKDM